MKSHDHASRLTRLALACASLATAAQPFGAWACLTDAQAQAQSAGPTDLWVNGAN